MNEIDLRVFNKPIQSKNFYIGSNRERTGGYHSGRIYLNGEHFANFYSLDEYVSSYGKGRMYAFNRDNLALEMECPVIDAVPSLDALLLLLESFLVDYKRNQFFK